MANPQPMMSRNDTHHRKNLRMKNKIFSKNSIGKQPKLGWKLLGLMKHYEREHAISGDLGEEFEERIQINGRYRTLCWYWGQLVHTLTAYFKRVSAIGGAMFNNYIKTTWRNIKKNKLYSFINILGLAVGMACCILILLWVQDELSYDKFHENYHSIYRTIPELQGAKYAANPLALAKTFKAQYPEVQEITRYCGRGWLFKYGGNIFNQNGALVDDDFFKVFTFPLIKGDPDNLLKNKESVVLTERTAATFFGNEDPLGKTILVNNRFKLIVTGIIKNVPRNSHIRFDFLASTRRLGKRGEVSWSYEAATYALMKPNFSPKPFAEKISGFMMQHDKRTKQKVLLHIQPLTKAHLYSLNGTDPIIYIYIFLIIAIAILVIACINFINLATARANTRAKEIGLRKVMGAEKANIIRQFIGESVFFSILSFAAALGLTYLFLPLFNNLAQKQLTLNIVGNAATFLLLIGIIVFTGFVSGIYPAFMLSSYKPANVLKTGSKKTGSRGFMSRKILVVSQFTAAIILIIGTIVMYKQLNYIKNKDLGLNRDHVVVIPMNGELRQKYRSFKDTLKQNSRVINVTAARRIPTNIGHMNPVYWEGKGEEDYVTMTDAAIDYDYFETMGMEIIEGRSFSRQYTTDIKNYILNEEALRVTGLESPIGKMFSVWKDEGKIIGIVRNFHASSLHSEIGPVIFTLSQRHGSYRHIFVKIRPDDVQGTIAYLKKQVDRFAPNHLFDYSFMDEEFNRQYGNDLRRGEIFSTFTFLAIFISCLGLFGMASFTAEQRRKEIGVRKILGASIKDILALISKDFLLLLLFSNMIAWPIAYIIMNNMLKSYAYRTGIGLWIFIVSGAAVVCIALITVCVKIVKAALSNPVDSLRYE